MVRPYKQIEHSAEAARAAGARLLVAGDSVGPLPDLDGAELRLGYLSAEELERALGDSTVAVFPYRAELDQSGALLQALGAGVPAVVYDVGGLGEASRTTVPDVLSRLMTLPHWATPSASSSTTSRRSPRPAPERSAPARSSPGTLPRGHTSSSTASSRDLPPQPLRRSDCAASSTSSKKTMPSFFRKRRRPSCLRRGRARRRRRGIWRLPARARVDRREAGRAARHVRRDARRRLTRGIRAGVRPRRAKALPDPDGVSLGMAR